MNIFKGLNIRYDVVAKNKVRTIKNCLYLKIWVNLTGEILNSKLAEAGQPKHSNDVLLGVI